MIKELIYQPSGSVPYINMHHRVSWSAVFAGSVMTMAVLLCMGLLGAGIGLVSAPAAEGAGSAAMGIGIGAAAWAVVSGLVAFYIGGWFAGRLTGIGMVSDSVIHGLISWSATVLIMGFFLTSAIGAVFGGLTGMLGQSLGSAVGSAAREAASEFRGRDAGSASYQPAARHGSLSPGESRRLTWSWRSRNPGRGIPPQSFSRHLKRGDSELRSSKGVAPLPRITLGIWPFHFSMASF
ncbi:MAG: hypothetical protein HY549_05250 [Elusimicrobia bacterium]|nr:hypothetical protein [Elusimicrobiota bacterium]